MAALASSLCQHLFIASPLLATSPFRTRQKRDATVQRREERRYVAIGFFRSRCHGFLSLRRRRRGSEPLPDDFPGRPADTSKSPVSSLVCILHHRNREQTYPGQAYLSSNLTSEMRMKRTSYSTVTFSLKFHLHDKPTYPILQSWNPSNRYALLSTLHSIGTTSSTGQ